MSVAGKYLMYPDEAYKYAMKWRGKLHQSEIIQLEDAVLSSAYSSYWFAFYIPGADIEKLENAVLNVDTLIINFAKYIKKGKNIENLEDAICCKEKHILKFLLTVPNANADKLTQFMSAEDLQKYNEHIIKDIIE